MAFCSVIHDLLQLFEHAYSLMPRELSAVCDVLSAHVLTSQAPLKQSNCAFYTPLSIIFSFFS